MRSELWTRPHSAQAARHVPWDMVASAELDSRFRKLPLSQPRAVTLPKVSLSWWNLNTSVIHRTQRRRMALSTGLIYLIHFRSLSSFT